jgi:FAD/FMN-containing dehydrogenase
MGGGLSFGSRHLGLGADNVVEFKVVLANGTAITADEYENPDMFWALRGGGGGSFGVVTSVRLKLWQDEPLVEVDAISGISQICTNTLGTHAS